MNSLALRCPSLAAGLLIFSASAHAHPGHDGHDFTWEFRHLAAHPLATVLCVLVLGAALWGGRTMVRRLQTLRASHARRGK